MDVFVCECDPKTLRLCLSVYPPTYLDTSQTTTTHTAPTLATLLGAHPHPLPKLRLELKGAIPGDRLPTEDTLETLASAIRAQKYASCRVCFVCGLFWGVRVVCVCVCLHIAF